MTVEINGEHACPQWHSIIETVAGAVLDILGQTRRTAVCVVLCDDKEIARLNEAHRGIAEATDVLSFPQTEFHGQPASRDRLLEKCRPPRSPETGEILLGDIVLSIPALRRQAAKRGHADTYELGVLVAHSMLHLLGYDHPNTAGRRRMYRLEQRALYKAGLGKGETE